MSHYVGRNVDYTQPTRNIGELTFLATDGYGRLVTVAASGTGVAGDFTSAQLHADLLTTNSTLATANTNLLLIDTDLKNGTAKTQIVDGLNRTISSVVSADGYALEAAEQYAAVGEDNTNGVFAICTKPIANSSYSLSYASTSTLVTSLLVKASPGKIFKMSGFLNYSGTDGYQHYIHLHNATSLPANTAIPLFSLPIDTRSSSGPVKFEFEFAEEYGLYLNTGIVLAFSRTAGTLTISTDYTGWIQCSYI
jgi:hypothetical protein